MALHNASVGRRADPVINRGADGDIDVQIIALVLVAYPSALLGFKQIDNRLQLLEQALVFVQKLIDMAGVTHFLKGFMYCHPVGAIALQLVIPLGVETRGE